jgi:hypothetical protein
MSASGTRSACVCGNGDAGLQPPGREGRIMCRPAPWQANPFRIRGTLGPTRPHTVNGSRYKQSGGYSTFLIDRRAGMTVMSLRRCSHSRLSNSAFRFQAGIGSLADTIGLRRARPSRTGFPPRLRGGEEKDGSRRCARKFLLVSGRQSVSFSSRAALRARGWSTAKGRKPILHAIGLMATMTISGFWSSPTSSAGSPRYP